MKKCTNIIDSPLEGGSGDLLGVSDYVEALSSFLSSASMPTTIAIQGEWGSGKTSFMNQIKSRLCDDADEKIADKPFHGIWVNMWEYSMMKNPEDILINVIKGLTNACAEVYESRSEKGGLDVQDLKKKTWSFLKATSALAAKVGMNAMGLDGEKTVNSLVDNFKGDDGLSLKEVRPRDFRNAFEKVVTECLAQDQKNGETSKKGFMFFIDDLDRIPPENAVRILELLKNLFEVDNCIFVLAIDYEVVVKGLKAKFGAESQMDERAYRSFFDKIIQMPFSMPIGAYNITGFVATSVESIGVFSGDELKTELTLNDEKSQVSDILSDMVFLSTGTNPRSIKRLLNSLSLIDIMHRIKMKKERENGNEVSDMTPADKAMNFGLVCVQVAYPDIYDLLVQESNFLDWDEASARDFRLPALSPEKSESLKLISEFDEVWEQVLYRACQKSVYLSNRALNVSRLLNKIRYLCSDMEGFSSKISELLGMSAVTTVTSSDLTRQSLNRNSRGSLLLENIDELNLGAMTIEQRHNLYNVIEALGANIEPKFVSSNSGDYIDFKIKIFKKLKDFVNVRPRKKGYRLRFYLPEEETYNKYENLTQAANQYGYTYKAYNDVHVYRFGATIKDSESENNAYEFIRMSYKVWMEYIENLDKE
jgi:hypothetical protein